MRQELSGVPVLVTGATGFIGSHLASRLIAEQAEVHVVCRSDPRDSRIAGLLDRLHVHRTNLADAARVKDLVSAVGPVKVYHLAAHTNVQRGFETADDALDDLAVSVNLMRAVHGGSCDCFIQTGTCEEYGDHPAPFHEDLPPLPVSAYSASKSAQTLFAQMYHRTMGLPVVVLRPFLTYGPGQSPTRFISQVIERGLSGTELPMTGGEQTREFNYITDIVDGFVRASVTPEAIGEIINLGCGVEYSLRQVVEEISACLDEPVKARFGAVPYRAGETWHFYSDSTKARKMLGWAPRTGLREGLLKTIAWCRENNR